LILCIGSTALSRPPFWNESPYYNKTNLPVIDSIFM
jgi:hypothetical protein